MHSIVLQMRNYSQNIILVGLALSLALFFSGCRCAKRPTQSDNTAVRYSQPRDNTSQAPATRQYHDNIFSESSSKLAQPMVQLTSFELAQAGGDYPAGGQSGTVF